MTDELKHSELPWVKEGIYIISSEFSDVVCDCFTDNDDRPQQEKEANAQLIVESVNNAARYKEALEAIPMVLNMGASQQDVLNIVNNALKED